MKKKILFIVIVVTVLILAVVFTVTKKNVKTDIKKDDNKQVEKSNDEIIDETLEEATKGKTKDKSKENISETPKQTTVQQPSNVVKQTPPSESQIRQNVENTLRGNEQVWSESEKNTSTKAIDLLKRKINNDNFSYNIMDQISLDEYIISVSDKATTQVIDYYRVNVATGNIVKE